MAKMVSNQLLLSKEKKWLDDGIYLKSASTLIFKIKTKTELSLIEKLKELLRAVHTLSDNDWNDLELAVLKLPNWFLEKSPQPMKPSEEAEWLNMWREASPENKEKMDIEQGWAPIDWLYWMNPASRHSFLLGYSLEEESFVFGTSEWDTPIGAIKWMLKITGHLIRE